MDSCFLSSGKWIAGLSTFASEDRLSRGTGLRRELDDWPPAPSPLEDESFKYAKFAFYWLGLV